MKELYPALIGLFGAISAISVAYLILLYEQANKRRQAAKNSVVFEVEGSLHCSRVVKATGLEEGNDLRSKLLDKCRHKSVAKTDVLELKNSCQVFVV